MERLFDLWQTDLDRESVCSILIEKYELYAKKLFSHYEPLTVSNANSAPRDFFQRLDLWLRNFKIDETQWEAFRLVDEIFYVGRNELVELYRVAFEMIVPDWIGEVSGLDLRSPTYCEEIEQKLDKTWFCPITDSLRISAFRHINHIEKPEYFPDWRSLSLFGKEESIKQYIAEQKFEQIVLLEDFVGSGRQALSAIELAKKVCDIPVLVVPLVIGTTGDENLSKIATASQGKIAYRPVLVLSGDCVIKKVADKQEPESCASARNIISAYKATTGDKHGYGFEKDQGYLFVAEANCPNNTIKPIYSEESWKRNNIQQNWNPLFPRSGRKKAK